MDTLATTLDLFSTTQRRFQGSLIVVLSVLHLREIKMKTMEKKKKGMQELKLGKCMVKLKKKLLQQVEQGTTFGYYGGAITIK
jgi:hypothetical protein